MMKLRYWFWAEVKDEENSAQTVFRILGNLSRWFLTALAALVLLAILATLIKKTLDSRDPIRKLEIGIKYSPSSEYISPVINVEILRPRFPIYNDLSDLDFFQKLYKKFGENISQKDFSRAIGITDLELLKAKSTLPEGFVLDPPAQKTNPFDQFDSPITPDQAREELIRRQNISRLIELRMKKAIGDEFLLIDGSILSEINEPIRGTCPKFIPLLVTIENKSNKPLEKVSLKVQAKKVGRSTNVLEYDNDKLEWDYIVQPNEKIERCFYIKIQAPDTLIWSIKPALDSAEFKR